MPRFARHLLAAAALLSLPAAVSAHRLWMLPSGTVFSGTDSWVTVDFAASNDLFYADHQPGRLEGVKVWQPDGTPGQVQNGATGRYRSVFDVKLDKPGTWKIGTAMSGVMGSFKVNGVEQRVGGRGGPPGPDGVRRPPLTVADIPADATDVQLVETANRNEIFVTSGAPTRTVLKPSAKGLEIDFVTHPDELVAGEPARFRFLVDGRPAPGLKVTVVPGGKRYRNAEGARELTTGTDGMLSIDWPAAGMYWLSASHEDAKPSVARATGRRLSYVTTLEVMTP
ncbi:MULTISPECIES: DUF4198 domain-containing protein [unclassified Sphingomonas]|uniref:DUF4198 domain-containing protein n=1 Tax=unclassified Sphingomonas TaxID=196159 RepID=UPI0006FAF621|nr:MULTISPECIES: DUF4198 domain-containing protein [unclassified Sphingomonas]KQM63526.1 nickel uptake transporter family protein [Sphingomonas sp. Leaf16]KQN15142.1 nickel uptake transporter family protein [Sphingomonas sp. Leaf29]KQN20677.1 nickel uptake transporter family protein [Sphingomonas sp. Leaf32]